MRRMIRRAGTAAATGLAIACVATAPIAARSPVKVPEPPRPPNVVVFLADDLGYGDVRFNAPGDYATPNMDRLAREGVTFTQGYVTAAVCSPSRAAIMTGRYQARSGHDFNFPEQRGASVSLPRTEPTLAERLVRLGYDTALIGKWHLGIVPGYRAEDRGFNQALVFSEGNVFIRRPSAGDSLIRFKAEGDRTARPWELRLNGTSVEEDGYLTEITTRRSVDFIQHASSEKPFFLVVSHHAPHVPVEATARYMDKVPGITNAPHRTYAAMVTALDDSWAEIDRALRARGFDRNTIVVLLSDNGCPEYVEGACSNGGLAGFKRDLREGGIRVPLVVRWPHHARAGARVPEPVSSLDAAATILDAAGWRRDDGPRPDGVSLRALLKGKSAPLHDHLFWRAGDNYAVREGRWKLISMLSGGAPRAFLYDLQSDPSESHDLAAANPKIVRRLQTVYAAWNAGNPPPQARPRSLDADYHGTPVTLQF